MKAMLLRIGIDSTAGGALGPIFDDGSFEYIPIPEGCDSGERKTYRNIIGRKGKPLSEFLQMQLQIVLCIMIQNL